MELRLLGTWECWGFESLEPSTLGQRLVSSERPPPAALGRHSRRGRAWHMWLMDCLVSSGEPKGYVTGAPGHNGMRLFRA